MRGTPVNVVAVLVGSGIGLAIGLLLLDVKRIRVANLLPALVAVVLLTAARLSIGW